MAWPEVVTAISTAIIALIALAVGVVFVMLLRRLMTFMGTLDRVVQSLDRDVRPMIDSVKTMVNDSTRVVGKVRAEVESIAETTHDVHRRVLRGIDETDERLRDLGALLDVIQEEVEDTVLDIGAALRTTRRGTGILKSVRRALSGRGKRRR